MAQQQCYEAADRILRIVSQSCEEHIQHINPFLSSTIWLASAVQLVRKHFSRAPTNQSLIKSRFDVLYLTYRRCVDFWGTQTAMQRNLESLEDQLEARKRKIDTRDSQSSSDHQTSHTRVSRYRSERVVFRGTEGLPESGCDAGSQLQFDDYVQSWQVSNRDGEGLGRTTKKPRPDSDLSDWRQVLDYRNRTRRHAAEVDAASGTAHPRIRRTGNSQTTAKS